MDRDFFLPFIAHASASGRKKTRGSTTCRAERANEANKFFYYMALLIIPGKERNRLVFDR